MNNNSLRKLNDQEKSQLLQLTKTREKIVLELSKFPSSQVHLPNYNPQLSLDNWSVESSAVPNAARFPPIHPGRQSRQKAEGRSSSKQRHQRESELSKTDTFDRLRTGLDMMPIMAKTGEVALDAGLSRGGNGSGSKMKLPVFKLPAIDPRQFLAASNSHIRTAAQGSAGTSSAHGRRTLAFQSYTDKKSFRHAMAVLLRSMSTRESELLRGQLGLSDGDLASVLAELDKEVKKTAAGYAADADQHSALGGGGSSVLERRRVFAQSDFFSADEAGGAALSTFALAKQMNDHGRLSSRGVDKPGTALQALRGGTVGDRLAGLGLTSDFTDFLTADSHLANFGHSRTASLPTMKQFNSMRQQAGQLRSSTAAAAGNLHSPLTEMSFFSSTSERYAPSQHGHSSGVKGVGTNKAAGGNRKQKQQSQWSNHKQSSGAGGSTTEELTRALVESLRTMDKHSKKIKREIETAQELISVQEAPRAKTLVLTVAAERLQPALYRLVIIDMRRGFTAWLLQLQQLRRQERVCELFRFLVVRNIVIGLRQLLHSVLKRTVDEWRRAAVQETQRLQRERLVHAIVLIQSIMRRYRAVKRCAVLKQRRKYQRLYDSTVKIQALLRGTVVKWRFRRSRKDQIQGKAATTAQKMMRAYLARKRVHALRQRCNKALAATNMQRIARGRQGRSRVAALRLARKHNLAAVQLQKIVRGFVSRRTMSTILVNRARFKYAVRIQAVMRGALTRMNRERKVAELQQYKHFRSKAATSISAAYRGYRARLLVRMKLYKLRKARNEQSRCATLIITVVRGFLCRAYLRDLRKARFERWVADARMWQEMWSDESASWFYLNLTSGEALWEPSAQGYVKFDGSLVLASGEIVEDPRLKKASTAGANGVGGAEEEEEEGPSPSAAEAKKKSAKLCSECADRVAIRACNECGDKFCTKCYKSTHATGSRRNHTYSAVGPVDCAECELVLAERWCVSCDEAYCDGCWRKVHSRGKRRFHPYSEVSAAGRVDSRIYTMDGEQLQNYDSTYAQQQQDVADGQQLLVQVGSDTEAATESVWGESTEEYGGGAGGGTEEWTEYTDAEGYPYWYNPLTGVSQYESPY